MLGASDPGDAQTRGQPELEPKPEEYLEDKLRLPHLAEAAALTVRVPNSEQYANEEQRIAGRAGLTLGAIEEIDLAQHQSS